MANTSISNRNFSLLSDEDFRSLSDNTRKAYYSKMKKRLWSIIVNTTNDEVRAGNNAMRKIPLDEKLTVLQQFKYGAAHNQEVMELIGYVYEGIPVPKDAMEWNGKKIIEVLQTLKELRDSGKLDILDIEDNWKDLSDDQVMVFYNDFAEIVANIFGIKAPFITVEEELRHMDKEVGGICHDDGSITMAIGKKGERYSFTGKLAMLYHEIIHSAQRYWRDHEGSCPKECKENMKLVRSFREYATLWNFTFLESLGMERKKACYIYEQTPHEKEAYGQTGRFADALGDFISSLRLPQGVNHTHEGNTILMLPKDKLSSLPKHEFDYTSDFKYADYHYSANDYVRMSKAFPDTVKILALRSPDKGQSFFLDGYIRKNFALYSDGDLVPVAVHKSFAEKCKNYVENFDPTQQPQTDEKHSPSCIITPEEYRSHIRKWLFAETRTAEFSFRARIETTAKPLRSQTYKMLGSYIEDATFSKDGSVESYRISVQR